MQVSMDGIHISMLPPRSLGAVWLLIGTHHEQHYTVSWENYEQRRMSNHIHTGPVRQMFPLPTAFQR
jgi:hypothetical protein